MPHQPNVRVTATIPCDACDGSGVAVDDDLNIVACEICLGEGAVDIAVSCRTCGDWYGSLCLRSIAPGGLMTTGDVLPIPPIKTDPAFACIQWRPHGRSPIPRYPPNDDPAGSAG